MTVLKYSLKADGDDYLSKNFQVKEFACRDGSDLILIDSELVIRLQMIRNFFGIPVYISSGYRTLKYNTAIGGAAQSQHMTGKAADFDVGSGKAMIDPRLVAMYADFLGFGGVGRYVYADGRSWVHADTGPKGKFWIANAPGKPYTYTDTFLPTLRRQLQFLIIPNKYEIEILQTLLTKLGFYKGTIDGKFGKGTQTAVKAFQESSLLMADGVVGRKTWNALFTKVKTW